MVIEIQLNQDLRRYFPQSSSGLLTVDVADGLTIKEILEELEISSSQVGACLVNHKEQQLSWLPLDGDRIVLYPANPSLKE